MTNEERELLRQKIEEHIIQAEKEIVHLEDATQPISPENSLGRISRMDAINNKSVAEAALRSSKKKIGRLKLALTKIDQPGFGNCARCKKQIAPMRLMLMPQSTECIRCAR